MWRDASSCYCDLALKNLKATMMMTAAAGHCSAMSTIVFASTSTTTISFVVVVT